MTGLRETIKTLPWRTIRRTLYALRRSMFWIERDRPMDVIAFAGIEDVTRAYQRAGYVVEWPFSYYYEGEDENMRKPHVVGGDERQRQVHVRLFWLDDERTGMAVHEELCPLNHPRGHLLSQSMDHQTGIDEAKMVLVSNGIEHDVFTDAERAAVDAALAFE
jgi:hypothetical protein